MRRGRDVPGDGRFAAADVGARGAARTGLAVYVAGEDALDQYFCRHPDEFLERPVESAILDHENEQIHAGAPAVRGARGSAERGGRASCSGRLGVRTPMLWCRRATCARSTGPTRCAVRRTSRRRACPCAPRRRTRSRSSTCFSGELIGTVEAARAFTTSHHGAVYLHSGAVVRGGGADLVSRRALVKPFDGDWYTQPKKETPTRSSGCWTGVRLPRRGAVLRRRPRDGDGDRLPAQAPARPRGDRSAWRWTCRRPSSRRGRCGTSCRRRGRGRVPGRGPAGRPARRRALPDRGAAAAGDVRSLGHRRAVDEPASADGAADDLHLRRAPGRRGDHAAGLRDVREPGRRCPPARSRVPVRVGLPVVCPVAEVREPQRAVEQGGVARADGADAGAANLQRT